MDELNLDNILDVDVENLFEEDDDNSQEEGKDKDKDKETIEVDPENIFEDDDADKHTDEEDDDKDKPESVGSEDKDKEDTTSTEDGTTPKNFYSSIAQALVEDGVYSIDDEQLSKIKTAEDFAQMIKEQRDALLDETLKRVNDALEAGVDTSEIQKYEKGIAQLEGITDEQLQSEDEQGSNIRKWVIYQDYISRGFSEERAKKELNKSLNAGTDVEDAQDALKSVIEHYKSEYQTLLDNAKEEARKEEEEVKAQAATLKKLMLEEKKVFGDVEIDKATRQKAFEAVSKPIYTDSKTGESFTAIQKYQKDNPVEFSKNLGIIFTLTNGFKDVDKLVKGKVSKEVKRGIRDLEHTLNNTRRTSSGNIQFVTGVNDDPESFFGKGMKLDL